jgi:peptide-methionine (R)-S-oxide reductase
MTERIERNDAEWHQRLTAEQFHITREKGTERAFTGEYWETETPGVYHCICCDQPLFDSQAKFDPGTGWPSFSDTIAESAVTRLADYSGGQNRTEAACSCCDAHLGHVFDDGPPPTNLRYSISSAALRLEPRE